MQGLGIISLEAIQCRLDNATLQFIYLRIFSRSTAIYNVWYLPLIERASSILPLGLIQQEISIKR